MAVPRRIDEEFNQRYYSAGTAANDPNYVKSVGTTGKFKPDRAANDASYVGERLKNADRSNIVRNIRTDDRVSAMPGSPRNQPKSAYETTDQAFNRAYSEKGIQPSSSLGKKITNTQLQSKVDNTRNLQVEYSNQLAQALPVRTKNQKSETSTTSASKATAARIRAFIVSYSIWFPGFFTYFFLQLPLAILSIIFFAAALTIDSIARSFTVVKEGDGTVIKYLKEGFSYVIDGASEVFGTFSRAVGFDITQFNPTNGMFLMMIIIISYAVILLSYAFLQYKLKGINPIFGAGGGSKFGLFILAFIGYTFPVFNLFPWFFPWTVAVVLYPE